MFTDWMFVGFQRITSMSWCFGFYLCIERRDDEACGVRLGQLSAERDELSPLCLSTPVENS